MDARDSRTAGDSAPIRRRQNGGHPWHARPFLTDRRQQDVRDAVRRQLHVRLLHAGVREQSPLLALHTRLCSEPRMHDLPVPHQVLSGAVGGGHGHVGGPEGGTLLYG